MLILLKGENDEENKKISLLIVVFCLVFICIVALSACDTNVLNDVLNKNGNQQEDDASQNENNKNDSDTEENADENDNQSGGEGDENEGDTGGHYIYYTKRYYYSETQPTNEGNFWHYDENGEIAIW